MYQEFVASHLEKYAGPIGLRWEGLIFAAATEKRRCHVAMTCGMSETPMNAPKPEWERLELCALLPPDWPLDPSQWESEKHMWPLRGLQRLAQIPFQNDSWLGLGHTVPNGEPPQPFSEETKLCCWWLLPSVELPKSFSRTFLPDGEVLNILNLVPLYSEELAVKKNQGFPSLLEQFGRKGISDILNPKRGTALKGTSLGRWFLGH